MNPFKYTFKFHNKAGCHTGEAESVEDLRKQIKAITRQGGDVEPKSVRVVNNQAPTEESWRS